MARKCIFAFTPAEPSYPPFINLTEEPDGRVHVYLRSPRLRSSMQAGSSAHMEIPFEELEALNRELTAYLNDRRQT